MKVRDMQVFLRENGCEALRIRGSHEIWRLPNNTTIALVVNHLNADVSRVVFKTIRATLAVAGITLEKR